MLQYHIYPGGRKRIVTFSFDDGSANDARLISLLDRYGLIGTFHLNGINYLNSTAEEKARVRALYHKHEIACHTLSHGWPTRMPAASLVNEVLEDRRILEEIAGYPVTGMSYPCGAFDDAVISVMRACGIEYARTVESLNDFSLPADFLKWSPTCHFRAALPLAERFMQDLDSEWTRPLFYIWGHSHELRSEEDWAQLEALLVRVSGSEKIWYATNAEIHQYLSAQKMLKISVDERIIYNPTALDLWLEKDKKEKIKIPAGQTVVLP